MVDIAVRKLHIIPDGKMDDKVKAKDAISNEIAGEICLNGSVIAVARLSCKLHHHDVIIIQNEFVVNISKREKMRETE